MKTKPIVLSFSLFFYSTIGFAQDFQIRGIIEDTDGQAIEFSTIIAQHLEDSTIQVGTTSKIKGDFLLSLPKRGSYQIEISFIGYQQWSKSYTFIEAEDLGVIQLELAANELDEVVVVGALKMIERKEDKLVFNVQSSPLKSGYDGMEVLERSPEVLIDQNGNILMRNEAATVLINGRESNLSGDNWANYIQNLRSEDIKSIELQTNLSANTDAESSGGVINIVLRKKPVGFAGNIRSDYLFKGQNDYRAFGGLNFNYGAERWNVYGNYNVQKNTGTTQNVSSIDYIELGNVLFENGAWENTRNRQNYQLGFVVDAMKNQVLGLEFFGTNYSNLSNNKSFVEIFSGNTLTRNGFTDFDGVTDNDLYNLTLNYAWTVDTLGSSVKFFADYSTQDLIRNNDVVSVYEQATAEGITERNNSSADTKIYSLQADVQKYFRKAKGLKLEAGSKWTYTDRENILLSEFLISDEWVPNERTRSFNYGEQVLAGYLSLSKTFLEKNFIKIGVRVEHTDLERMDLNQDSTIEQYYTDWFPSAYYSRALSGNNSISLSYSRRLRRPPFQFLNNYVVKINDFRFELGNPDLRPEYVNNYELSFKQKRQTFAAYFQRTNEAVNGIYFLEGEVSFYQKFNAGSQTQYGLTYNRFGNLFKWWYLNANASVFHRKFTEENGVDRFQRTTWQFRISNNFKINKTTSLDVSGSYRSRYEDAYYIAFPIYGVNIMLQKTFLDKRLSFRIYLNDVFNTRIYENERPFTDFKSIYSTKPQTRTLRLWLSYNFSGKNKVSKRTNNSKNDARRRL